ncbi:MAG: hypothetical protein PHR21_03780 [Oscillospiraceae bacterium]|nr:hypothetical protein [Oscillospiraceae bacterium]MDD4367866.1 hypothetical protein [Oscillospiraceae bacterium]
MRKFFTGLAIALILSFSISGYIFAETITLDSWSNNTYVQSYHSDNYFADTYTGTVSVRGADRKLDGSSYVYPAESRITYDVQGDRTVATISPSSDIDTNTKSKSIEVKDKWNLSSDKTQVYGYIKPAAALHQTQSLPLANQ